jgi:hypothetical protein
MSTKPPKENNPLRRGGRSSLSIEIPESVAGINERDASEATLPTDSKCNYPDYAVPPPTPSFSIKKASGFCKIFNQEDSEMSIRTPKSSNCETSTTSKTSIVKIPRAAKYQLQDQMKLARRFACSQNELTQSGGDSPLCVKKKMGRRGIQNHRKGIDYTIRCHPHNQKRIEAATIKGASTVQRGSQLISTSNTNANLQQKITSKTVNRNKQTIAVAPTPFMGNLEVSNAKSCPSVMMERPRIQNTMRTETNESVATEIEVIDISRDPDGPIPSVLFEESEDFWDTYLLDTYQQIASSNPEIQDFEPIPYPLMARGVPVYTENVDTGKDSDTIVRVNKHYETANMARAGSPASLKNDSDKNEKTVDKYGQAESNKGVVGPDSWQMNVINGMLEYLDEVKDTPYTKYSAQFHMTTNLCTKQHLDGHVKYRHLPGAIFEEIVHKVGGPTFLEIYKNSKIYSGDRQGHAAVAGYQSSGCQTDGYPSLVEVAVGYGFCMAKSLAIENKNSAFWDHNSIKYAVDHGSQKVRKMSSSHRLKFWKEHILNDNEK